MSENDFIIRNAKPDEVEACAKINAETFHFILEDRRKHILEHALQWQGVLVAQVEDEIAGYAIFDTDWFDSTFLKLIVVDVKFRRLGIAKALIQKIEREYCPSGRFFSSTEEDNTASVALHTKLGFVASGYLANLPQPHHEVFYFKPVK